MSAVNTRLDIEATHALVGPEWHLTGVGHVFHDETHRETRKMTQTDGLLVVALRDLSNRLCEDLDVYPGDRVQVCVKIKATDLW